MWKTAAYNISLTKCWTNFSMYSYYWFVSIYFMSSYILPHILKLFKTIETLPSTNSTTKCFINFVLTLHRWLYIIQDNYMMVIDKQYQYRNYKIIELYLVTVKVLPYMTINPCNQWLGQIWSCQHVHLQHWEGHPINRYLDSGSMLLPGKLAASGLLTGWYPGSMKHNAYYDDIMNWKWLPITGPLWGESTG